MAQLNRKLVFMIPRHQNANKAVTIRINFQSSKMINSYVNQRRRRQSQTIWRLIQQFIHRKMDRKSSYLGLVRKLRIFNLKTLLARILKLNSLFSKRIKLRSVRAKGIVRKTKLKLLFSWSKINIFFWMAKAQRHTYLISPNTSRKLEDL